MSSPEKLRKPVGENALENREKPLSGKVALVTGSSRDIGEAITLALVQEGVQIIGNYRDKKKRAEKVLMAIEQMDGRGDFVQADITIAQERERLQETLVESFGGKLDYLILNTSGNQETARLVCVEANNALIDEFLPHMNTGGRIILLQSVPGHYSKQLERLGKMPSFYDSIAQAKCEGEQLLRKRIPEYQEKGVSFVVVCPPEVEDTSNIRLFKKYDVSVSEKHAEISDMLGIPRTVTSKDVGEKVAELLKRKDLPQGYVELFGDVLDARSVLSEWYGDNAIFVDTLEASGENKGIGRLIVANAYTQGHFNEGIGMRVLPGHITIEAAAQVLGLIALNGKIDKNSMPLFQAINRVKFAKAAIPGEGLRINAEITDISKRGFRGSAIITNMEGQKVAEIEGLSAIVVSKDLARRLLRG